MIEHAAQFRRARFRSFSTPAGLPMFVPRNSRYSSTRRTGSPSRLRVGAFAQKTV